jgi:hypothetical protein
MRLLESLVVARSNEGRDALLQKWAKQQRVVRHAL